MEYKNNVGYEGNNNPTSVKETDAMNPETHKAHIQSGATNGYPMSEYDKQTVTPGVGTK